MFGSQVLDTIIGLVTLFLVLALGASSATEAVSRVLSKRANDLEAGIKAMLAGSRATDEDLKRVFEIFEGTTVYDSAKAAAGKTLFRRRWKKPSYLSAKAFADALEVLRQEAADSDSTVSAQLDAIENVDVRARVRQVIQGGVTTAGDVAGAEAALADAEAGVATAIEELAAARTASPAGDLPVELKLLDDAKHALEDAKQDLEAKVTAWKAELETWFDNTMDRVSGTYKRFTTMWLFVFGLVFAVGANASAFHVAEELWTDPITADAVADAVSNVITEDTSEETATTATPATTAATMPDEDDSGDTSATTVPADDPNNPFDNDIESIADATAQLEQLQIPVGWSADDLDHWRDNWRPEDWSSHMVASVLGWIVTALLVMQGAPFWFDLLTKAVSLRNAGGKPSPAIKDDTSATTQAIKNQSGDRGRSS